MQTLQRGRAARCLPAAATLVLFLVSPISATAKAGDQHINLFEQPAIQSSLAERSLMLSVATAGERLVAVGERGFILISDDQGASWTQVVSPVSVTLTRVQFPTSSDGWAVGHAGVVLHSGDGGRSWALQFDGQRAARKTLDAAEADTGPNAEERLAEAQRLVDEGPDKPFLDLHFFDNRRGIVVGAYGLAFTTDDGGQSWRSISASLDNPSALHLYDVLALPRALIIVGEQGLILRSIDGGRSFRALNSPATGTLFGVVGTSEDGLLAYGLRGGAYRSDDLGETWQAVPDRRAATLTSGARLSTGDLVLADESGALHISHDGGASFQLLPAPETGVLTDIAELNDGRLAVASPHGVFLVSPQASNRSAVREQ